MKNKKIIIAGGTGFIGQAVAKYFGKDNHIIILTRQAINGKDNRSTSSLIKAHDGFNITYWRWDAKNVEKHWAKEFEGADIVINLAGKSVNCRYTNENREEILRSRVESTMAIGKAISMTVDPPKLWVNAASATIYRHAVDKPQDEVSGELHSDFSVEVCKQWEKTFFGERTPFTRKVALRMSITLGEGGALRPLLNLVKFGLGGRQGTGAQMVSWIHVEDVCRAIQWISDHPDIEGVFNCTSPKPVTNTSFMQTLREVTGHPFGLPAPEWLLRLGSKLIGTETELILKSRWVLPAKLLQTGFQLRYPELKNALAAIIRNIPRKRYRLF